MSAAGTAIATSYESAQVGKPAPDFEIPSTRNIEKLNEPVKLSDYRGKVVLLAFWFPG
jgi:peroxiredoxin (alkyl hydroperoxide reductase subunit C)